MPRRSSVDLLAIEAVTHVQRGLVTAAQLAELGVARSTTHHRVRTGGTWQRLLPGIYLTHGGRPDPRQRMQAAMLYAGEPAALTGLDALHLLGFAPVPPETSPIGILVPHARQRRSAGFVSVERTCRRPGSASVDGLTVASPARAGVDAARRMTARRSVDALLSRLVQQDAVTVRELEVELRSDHRRCTALVRDAVESLAAGTRSAAEAELRRLWLTSGLPQPLWNPDLLTPTGRFVARPDAYVPSAGVAVEVESKEFHYGEGSWYATFERQSRVTSYGVTTVQVTPRRIIDDGARFMAELARTIVQHAGRLSPPVIVRAASGVERTG